MSIQPTDFAELSTWGPKSDDEVSEEFGYTLATCRDRVGLIKAILDNPKRAADIPYSRLCKALLEINAALKSLGVAGFDNDEQ
jgi:hypothetical protein